jgi:hypothetical protein
MSDYSNLFTDLRVTVESMNATFKMLKFDADNGVALHNKNSDFTEVYFHYQKVYHALTSALHLNQNEYIAYFKQHNQNKIYEQINDPKFHDKILNLRNLLVDLYFIDYDDTDADEDIFLARFDLFEHVYRTLLNYLQSIYSLIVSTENSYF